MNLDKFNSLNQAQQQAILTAARESTVFQREFARNFDANLMATWPDMGVTIVRLTDEEKAAFQQLGMGAGIFDTIRGRMTNPQFLNQTLEYLATR
jgi:TRAP-type C4-dicarboxylate transport system substrate-binding protein